MENLRKKISVLRKSTGLPVELLETIVIDSLTVKELGPLVFYKKYKSLVLPRLMFLLKNFENIVEKYPFIVEEICVSPEKTLLKVYNIKFEPTKNKTIKWDGFKKFTNLNKITLPLEMSTDANYIKGRVKTIVYYSDFEDIRYTPEQILNVIRPAFPYHNAKYSNNKITLKSNNEFKKLQKSIIKDSKRMKYLSKRIPSYSLYI